MTRRPPHILPNGLVLLLAGILAFLGCDHSKPNTDEIAAALGDFSNLDRADLDAILRISPTTAPISQVDQEIIFTAVNGSPPYKWSVSNKENGFMRVTSGTQARYVSTRVADNDVIVTDKHGDNASARITLGDGLAIVPSSGVLTFNGETLSVQGVGGDLPYTWTVTHTGRGTVVATGPTTATYTRTTEGDNGIVLTDGNGQTVTATVTQQDPTPPVISPSTATLSTNVNSVLLSVSGGTPPYTWSVVNGTGSRSPTTGTQTIYTKNPADPPGNYFVMVTDGSALTDTATISQE